MTQPSAETMAQYRRTALDIAGPSGFRRAMRAVAGWIDRGQLAGESLEMIEKTRYTGSRF